MCSQGGSEGNFTFLRFQNGFAEWRPVFMTGASLYIASAIYFILFGTADTQTWNYVEPVEREPRINRSSASSTDTTVTIPVSVPVKT